MTLGQNSLFSIVLCFSLLIIKDANSFSVLDGIEKSIGTVYTIHASKNEVWIGGENGLAKLVGNHITFIDSDDSPFAGSDIEDLFLDSNGELWIVTFGAGVFRMNTRDSNTKFISVSDVKSRYCRNVNGIKHSYVIFTCGKKVFRYSIDSKLIDEINRTNQNVLSDITEIVIGSERIFFVDSFNKLFLLADGINSEIELPNSMPEINALYKLNGALLIGTDMGLSILELESKKLVDIDSLKFEGAVTSIFSLDAHNIWIYQNSFKRTFLDTGSIESWLTLEHTEKYSFPQIFDVEVISKDAFLFSAPIVGVEAYNQVQNSVVKLTDFEDKINTIEHSIFFNDKTVIATNGHLSVLNSDYSLAKKSEYVGFVNAMSQVTKDTLVLASDELGLQVLKLGKNENFESRQLDFDGHFGTISTLTAIEDYLVLIGLSGGDSPGLFVYDIKLGTVKQILNGVHPDQVIRKKDGNFAIATRSQGIIYDFDISAPSETLETVGSYNYINNCLFEDKNNDLWVCTDGGGLAYLDMAVMKLKFIDSTFTNKSRYVRDLVQDSEGYFWVATNKGLARYDPMNRSSISLGEEFGINDTDFEITASLNLKDGLVLIAGDTENLVLLSSELNKTLDVYLKKKTTVSILDLMVLNEDEQKIISRKEELYESVLEKKSLTFSDGDILINFSFAADDFFGASEMNFEYRLLGLDSKWVETSDGENTASFSTLPQGEYTFQVRVINDNSLLSQPITSIGIIALPPIWQTWQAYTLYVVLSIILVFAAYKYKTFLALREKQRLETSVFDRSCQLATSQNRLVTLLHQKESLFAQISHELKTPLSLITAPVHELDNMTINDEQRKHVDVIKKSSDRLCTLVNQVMDLTVADISKLTGKEEYDLALSLNIVVDLFRPTMALKKQILQVDISCSQNASLVSDSLEKILSNILINAYKHTPKNKLIAIHASDEDDVFKLIVSDEGCGIKKSVLKNIFKKTKKTKNESENKSVKSGHGMGLPVVKELVKMNGGNVKVKSAVGVGTTITITIPIRKSQANPLYSLLQPSSGFITSKHNFPDNYNLSKQDDDDSQPTILLVEDDPEVLRFVSDLFVDEFIVLFAHDGEKAYELSIEFLPDVIISDLVMPNVNGFDLVDLVRNSDVCCHIPFILLTGQSDEQTKLSSYAHLVDDFIAKPFKGAEIQARVKKLISIRNTIASKFGIAEIQKKPIFSLEEGNFHTERDKLFFDKFNAWLEATYSKEGVTRIDAANALAISERQLNRKLNALTNMSFSSLLRLYRLSKGKQALVAGRQISQAAYDCGFSAPAYFSNCFKAEYGQSPKAFVDGLKF